MGKIVLSPSDPFSGIAEKLNRSKENIENLQFEIARHFGESPYPVYTNGDNKIILEAVEYHASQAIPPRFSVLAGEIIHHLRSCLDHIVWYFSDPDYRDKNIKWIDFPILREQPAPNDMFTKYERKLGGISNANVLGLIEFWQPYQDTSDLRRLLLFAVHDMDINDKHRELNIVMNTPALQFPMDLMQRQAAYLSKKIGSMPVELTAEFERNGKFIPQIAFKNFIGREEEIVEQALTGMHNNVLAIVREFSTFLPG